MKVKFIFLILIVKISNINSSNYDLTICGFINHADGIGQIPLNFINTLNNDLSIQFLKTREIFNPTGLKQNYLQQLKNNSLSLTQFKEEDCSIKNIALYTDLLWLPNWDKFKRIIFKGPIFAYSMTEYTQVPNDWVYRLNNFFDELLFPMNIWLMYIRIQVLKYQFLFYL